MMLIPAIGELTEGIYREVPTSVYMQASINLLQANFVVTCTKRKKRLPEESLKLRHVRKSSIEDGFDAWIKRVNGSEHSTLPARSMYAGDHWSVATSLEQIAASSGYRAAIWVCSAGYGLIGIDSEISPYSATFSSSHPDTVCRWGDGKYRRSYKEIWWQLLTEWPGPDPDAPRSITDLAAAYPARPLVVVASRDYMEGIFKDCKKARDELEDPNLLSIVSVGSRDLPGLSANLLPSDISLRLLVGGSVRALNIRYTRKILEEVGYQDLRASVLHRKCMTLVAQSPKQPSISRTQTSDDEIQEFIWAALKQYGMTGRTVLLRRLRESGRACGQNRFSRIFDTAVQASFLED